MLSQNTLLFTYMPGANGNVCSSIACKAQFWKYSQTCLSGHLSVAVFTWARITFRKTFRIAIQNVIGIVIWTTCVHMPCKRLPNHDQDLRTASDILLLLRSPRMLIDPCAYAWLQRAFLKCTRTNHVPKELCVHMS